MMAGGWTRVLLAVVATAVACAFFDVTAGMNRVGKPKRPPNCFMPFCKENSKKVAERYPALNNKDITKKIPVDCGNKHPFNEERIVEDVLDMVEKYCGKYPWNRDLEKKGFMRFAAIKDCDVAKHYLDYKEKDIRNILHWEWNYMPHHFKQMYICAALQMEDKHRRILTGNNDVEDIPFAKIKHSDEHYPNCPEEGITDICRFGEEWDIMPPDFKQTSINGLQTMEASYDVEKPKPLLNCYFLFCMDYRKKYAKRFPELDKRKINMMLGNAWNNIPPVLRKKYEEVAWDIAKEFKRRHPGNTYNPNNYIKEKKQRKQARDEKKQRKQAPDEKKQRKQAPDEKKQRKQARDEKKQRKQAPDEKKQRKQARNRRNG